MSNFEVGLIIALVIGVIASNLAVLKYTAKFKLPQFGKSEDQQKKQSTPPPTDSGADNEPDSSSRPKDKDQN